MSVDERIMEMILALKQQLDSLPFDDKPETMDRAQEIREKMNVLSEIREKFCPKPEPIPFQGALH